VLLLIMNGVCVMILGLIALLDPYLSKSYGYGPLTNLNTKQPLMFWVLDPQDKKK